MNSKKKGGPLGGGGAAGAAGGEAAVSSEKRPSAVHTSTMGTKPGIKTKPETRVAYPLYARLNVVCEL